MVLTLLIAAIHAAKGWGADKVKNLERFSLKWWMDALSSTWMCALYVAGALAFMRPEVHYGYALVAGLLYGLWKYGNQKRVQLKDVGGTGEGINPDGVLYKFTAKFLQPGYPRFRILYGALAAIPYCLMLAPYSYGSILALLPLTYGLVYWWCYSEHDARLVYGLLLGVTAVSGGIG